MRSRFITNILVLVAGAVVVVSSQAFSPGASTGSRGEPLERKRRR